MHEHSVSLGVQHSDLTYVCIVRLVNIHHTSHNFFSRGKISSLSNFQIYSTEHGLWASQVAQWYDHLLMSDAGREFMFGSSRSPVEGKCKSFCTACGRSHDRGTWRAIVQGSQRVRHGLGTHHCCSMSLSCLLHLRTYDQVTGSWTAGPLQYVSVE